MTREQIEKAALEYAKTKHTDKNLIDIVSWDYIAGAESRQPEIDELVKALRKATEWVGVETELPPKQENNVFSTEVLFKTKSEIVRVGHFNYDNERWVNDREHLFLDGTVTHWRPINSPKAAELLKKYKI